MASTGALINALYLLAGIVVAGLIGCMVVYLGCLHDSMIARALKEKQAQDYAELCKLKNIWVGPKQPERPEDSRHG